MSAQIRPATAADQPTIVAMIRTAQLNPSGLDWRRFLVAEVDGAIAAIGQVKPHRDGSRELASIAVVPARRGEGHARRVIDALLARETSSLFLTCEYGMEPFYVRFGFQPAPPPRPPASLRRFVFAINLLLLFTRQSERLRVMYRPAPAEGSGIRG